MINETHKSYIQGIGGFKTYKSRRVFSECSENCVFDSDCNSIVFYNNGAVDAYVEGLPLAVGDSISFGGENPIVNEITRFGVMFAPTAGIKKIIVVKRYIST